MKRFALPLPLMAAPAHAGTQLWLDAYGGKTLDESARLALNQDLMFGPDNTWSGGKGRVGPHASLGLSWQPSPGFAVFTEYRYQQLRFHLEHTDDILLATQYLQTTGRVESEAVLIGISFRLLDSPAAAAP
ncbi:MAG: hypothetical protein V4729_07920 [Pseudomonadota bacterium]